MNETDRKAIIRKITIFINAASDKQLGRIWRYVKVVMFGVME